MEIWDLMIKLMKSTDISFNTLLSDEAKTILFDVKTYFEKAELKVFKTASHPIKVQFMRSLVYESDLLINGKVVVSKHMTIQEKFELYILWEYYKAIHQKEQEMAGTSGIAGGGSAEEFVVTLEKLHRTTNEYGMAEYTEFKEKFMSSLSFWDVTIAF